MTLERTEVEGVIGAPSAVAYACRSVATANARRTAGLLMAGVVTTGSRTSTTPLSGRATRPATSGAWSWGSIAVGASDEVIAMVSSPWLSSSRCATVVVGSPSSTSMTSGHALRTGSSRAIHLRFRTNRPPSPGFQTPSSM